MDCIVTDHAPHHTNDKNVEYNLAAFGISGIETSLGFAIKYLYKAGVLSLPEIAERMSGAPAKILGLDGGEIKEGGGLSTLRRRIEREGGSMVTQAKPGFRLTVTVPKDKEGIL